MTKAIACGLLPLVLAGCSLVPSGSGEQPTRQDTGSVTQAERPSTGAASSFSTRADDRVCLTELGSTGARFSPLPDRYDGQGCTNLGTVQLIALRSDDAELAIANLGPVTCPVSQAFASWARFGVDRAARQVFGTRLERIETFGSYACRNVARTSRRSAHATAEAIDIAAFRLANGVRISVLDDWNGGSAQEREFLRLVRASACRRFDTVLSPDYNADHHDHLHVEGVVEGTSYCR